MYSLVSSLRTRENRVKRFPELAVIAVLAKGVRNANSQSSHNFIAIVNLVKLRIKWGKFYDNKRGVIESL